LELVSKIKSSVKFINPNLAKTFSYFSSLVEKNKSFCIFPFIELLVNYDYTTVCCRSTTPVSKISELRDFRSDKNYKEIREKMIAGIKIPEHCSACYNLESQGSRSARQQETVEWAQRLDIKTLADLDNIKTPVYYEVRPGNKCNLLCRTCNPLNSHLIEREYRTIGIIPKDKRIRYKHLTGCDIVDLQSAKKVYVAGGEPTISKEFYQFLDRCIQENKTNIEILVNTNGTILNERLKKYLQILPNLQFTFSIDGYKELNHYIRWPSIWEKIVANWHYLREHHRIVTVNTTVSIYNIDSLHLLYEFIDREFPDTYIHWNFVDSPAEMSPYLHPDRDRVLESLEKIKQTQCYLNNTLFANNVDGVVQYFKNQYKERDLSGFFEINNRLDISRNISLKDYCPLLYSYQK